MCTFVIDTDFDGLGDDDEVTLGTDPLDPDSDDDGLEDGDEVDGTDPMNPDSDGGGVNDGDEVDQGTDPLEPSDDGTPGLYLRYTDGDTGADTDVIDTDGGDTDLVYVAGGACKGCDGLGRLLGLGIPWRSSCSRPGGGALLNVR